MPDPILTTARNALWQAIEEWPALEDVFQRTYKFDEEEEDFPEVNPTPEELPAIMIYPDPGLSRLVLNKATDHDYKLLILVFIATWKLNTPDRYWQEIVKAAFQSGGGTPYVKLATGFYPQNEFTVAYDRIMLDGVKATLLTIGLTLQVRWNPQG